MSGNIRPQLSQVAEPLWTDSGINSGIIVRELISTSNKKTNKKAQAVNEWSNILQNSAQARKKPPPPHHRAFTVHSTSFIANPLQAAKYGVCNKQEIALLFLILLMFDYTDLTC